MPVIVVFHSFPGFVVYFFSFFEIITIVALSLFHSTIVIFAETVFGVGPLFLLTIHSPQHFIGQMFSVAGVMKLLRFSLLNGITAIVSKFLLQIADALI